MTVAEKRPNTTDLLLVVEQACRRRPDEPVLIFEDGLTVSRRTLWNEVVSFASYLAGQITTGDRVAVMLDNRTEFMVTWLAAVACRAVLVPLNPTLRLHDAGHILHNSRARLVVAAPDHVELLSQLQPECPALEEIVVVEGDEPFGLSRYGALGRLDDLPRAAVVRRSRRDQHLLHLRHNGAAEGVHGRS